MTVPIKESLVLCQTQNSPNTSNGETPLVVFPPIDDFPLIVDVSYVSDDDEDNNYNFPEDNEDQVWSTVKLPYISEDYCNYGYDDEDENKNDDKDENKNDDEDDNMYNDNDMYDEEDIHRKLCEEYYSNLYENNSTKSSSNCDDDEDDDDEYENYCIYGNEYINPCLYEEFL